MNNGKTYYYNNLTKAVSSKLPVGINEDEIRPFLSEEWLERE
jgi:hypothetical protein